jgi:hypothetical protein
MKAEDENLTTNEVPNSLLCLNPVELMPWSDVFGGWSTRRGLVRSPSQAKCPTRLANPPASQYSSHLWVSFASVQVGFPGMFRGSYNDNHTN